MEHMVFLDRNTLRVELPRPAFPHTWRDYETTAEADAAARLAGATIAVTNKIPLRRATLEQLPALKLIAVAATGLDVIDLDYCRERGLPVTNVRDYAVHSVPEHVFALLLALRRQLFAYRADVRAGAWQKAQQFCLIHRPLRDLHGSTLGVVGYGSLGRGTAKLGEGFGMRVLVAERKDATEVRPGRVSFARMLARSDAVSLHCPLTPATRNLIGAAELAQMKPGALLINTARGALVDADALIAALHTGRLAGAACDVLPVEPPREGHPLLDLDLPNFILTPHHAWASDEAMHALARQLVDNLEAFVAGRPQNLV
jgi:glycerate dehydrogenase